MHKRSTIKDVAIKAGVSFKTVSRVINNEPGVKSTTRSKVVKIINQIGYQPNLAAKTIRTNKSHIYGFITDQIATTPYAVDIIKGAQRSASEKNKILFVINTGVEDEFNQYALDMLIQRNVEGIIFAAMYHRNIKLPTLLKGIPFVLANCFSEDIKTPSVVPDEFKGGVEATERLIKKGHKRIAMLNLPEDSIAAQLRLDGYINAHQKYHIDIDEKLIRTVVFRKDNDEENRAFQVTKGLLKQADDRPTALFCANDRIAMRAYDAIKTLGLAIPEDVAVIGYDNQELIANNLYPGLSSMALPHEEMGKWAVEKLYGLDKEDNNTDVSYPVKRKCHFVERGSI